MIASLMTEETPMSPRVTSDLLLVGSVPATSTADALRAGRRTSRTSCSRCRMARPGRVRPGWGMSGNVWSAPTASKFLPDFGVALYCGFRVPPGSTPEQAIREHRDVVRAVRRS